MVFTHAISYLKIGDLRAPKGTDVFVLETALSTYQGRIS